MSLSPPTTEGMMGISEIGMYPDLEDISSFNWN